MVWPAHSSYVCRGWPFSGLFGMPCGAASAYLSAAMVPPGAAIMISSLAHPGPTVFAAGVGVLALSGVLAACGSSTPKAVPARSSTSTAASAAVACRALGAWENGTASDRLINDPARLTIANLGRGTQFGVDFASWMRDGDSGNIAQSESDATLISLDCQVAGVPGILSVSSDSASGSAGPSSSASASAPTMTRQTDSVVFKVSGSGYPSVQYGSDSDTSNPQGGYGPLGDGEPLPWSASMTYNSTALYYAVSAQLEGSGDISDSVTEVITTYCSDGSHRTESFPLASGTASGGYAIAQAEYTGGDTGNATQAESDAGC
jgi:hypothetical protein